MVISEAEVEAAHVRMESGVPFTARDILEAAARAQRPTWRCFQCDKVFTDNIQAEKHFGLWPLDAPMCCNEWSKDALYWRGKYTAAERRNEQLCKQMESCHETT